MIDTAKLADLRALTVEDPYGGGWDNQTVVELLDTVAAWEERAEQFLTMWREANGMLEQAQNRIEELECFHQDEVAPLLRDLSNTNLSVNEAERRADAVLEVADDLGLDNG